MKYHRFHLCVVSSCLLACTATLMPALVSAKDEKKKEPAADTTELARKAGEVLERCCVDCHSGPGSKAGQKYDFDVRDAKSLIDGGVVIPKPKDVKEAESWKVDDSDVWKRMHQGSMPPPNDLGLARPSPNDGKVIRDWIEAGAPEFPAVKGRTPIALHTTLELIKKHLEGLRNSNTRRTYRYFSLIELYNQPHISEVKIDLARAALAKALNSLSWERSQVTPEALDKERTIYAVDIEKLGWTRDHWRAIRRQYPYALGFRNLDDHHVLDDLESDIKRLADNNEPLYMIRADWFVATATQPPLYHALLYDLTLPELKRRPNDHQKPANPKCMTAGDLEQFLGFDIVDDIEKGEDRAMRAGFTGSRVSGQNRLIERHKTQYGAYWRSYDFKAENPRAILSRYPLGPEFPGNKFSKIAFRQDGGEIIFHLPNGLQGYMLVDGKDNRIDAGPIEVVSDSQKTSGTPSIVNGLSCIACHNQGIINPPKDEIRSFSHFYNEARDQVERLYPENAAFSDKLKDDETQFTDALSKVVGKMLKTNGDSEADPAFAAEPVGATARRYLLKDLDLEAVAAELYEPDTTRLKQLLQQKNPLLMDLGLGVLLSKDGKIKRAFWEGRQNGPFSIMQLTASELDYSTIRND